MNAPTPIPFVDLGAQRARIGDRIDAAVARVMAHGRFIMGPEIGELEAKLAEFCGARHAITCASGTDALLLVLLARGIGAGDAVFIPAFTFTATAEVAALIGATPVFVDVREDDFNLDTASLEAAIGQSARDGLRPAAVIAVDLFGQPADYPAIHAIAAAHDLYVIADAAQSFGATLDGKPVGTLAPATATSFFPAKPLGCYGDGGAVLTDDDELAAKCRSLRVHGKGGHKYDIIAVGLNSRLDTLQAAILIEKLAIFPDEIEARQHVADAYTAAIGNHAITPQLRPGATSVWAQYTLRITDRERVSAALKDHGIPTAVYYPNSLNRQSAYAGYPVAPGGVPIAERLTGEVLSLPMHPYLDGETTERIAGALRASG